VVDDGKNTGGKKVVAEQRRGSIFAAPSGKEAKKVSGKVTKTLGVMVVRGNSPQPETWT